MLVEIAMATYNGEAYVSRQIDSILAQSHQHWRLLVRDDGSTDATVDIVRGYQAKYPDQIVLIEDCRRGGGASANFGLLLEASTAAYVMCCDQDDEWLPNKVDVMLRQIRTLEERLGDSAPLLVHCDLQVIDSGGREMASSFWEYQKLDPRWALSFPRLLSQNVVTGCAMLVNRALLKRALPVPPEAVMHDWWLALVACAFGRVHAVPEQLVRYRQHGRNDVGAKRFDLGFVVRRFCALLDRSATRAQFNRSAKQANAFCERFLGAGKVAVDAETFAGLRTGGWLKRRVLIIRHGFWKVGLLRNLGWFMSV